MSYIHVIRSCDGLRYDALTTYHHNNYALSLFTETNGSIVTISTRRNVIKTTLAKVPKVHREKIMEMRDAIAEKVQI